MQKTSEPVSRRKKLPVFVRPKANYAIQGKPRIDSHHVYHCHRLDGRTIPCTSLPCSFCAAGWTRDDRILIALERIVTCNTEILDLPMTCHAYLATVESKCESLREVILTASREKPFDNARIILKAMRMASEEKPACVLEDFDTVLDAAFEKNTQYGFDQLVNAKSAAIESPVLRYRGAS